RTVRCWGAGERGQLGRGSTEDAPVPVVVEGLGAVRDLLAGDDFACALEQSGIVRCWGANDRGQLGAGTTEDALRPVAVRW
ncbi:MAG: RCC1 repeat-containing protein, partial [Deltaproteobacteria bacterium]|nr:RCC1 repeat-containing protein [Deltaproteobacteria bacterium]